MTPIEFCYWLQGYFELTLADSKPVDISAAQVEEIQNHLKIVFNRGGLVRMENNYLTNNEPVINWLFEGSC